MQKSKLDNESSTHMSDFSNESDGSVDKTTKKTFFDAVIADDRSQRTSKKASVDEKNQWLNKFYQKRLDRFR